MRFSVLPAGALCREHVQLWSHLQQTNPSLASPYFRPEFTMAVASVRGDVYVAMLEEAGETVGFFPFQRSRLGVGRPVGGALSDYHGVVAGPDCAWNAAELVRACRLRVWDFDHVPLSQAPLRPHRTAERHSPIMDLSDGYEAYVRGRSEAGSREIRQTQRKRRKLEREVGPIRFEPQVRDRAVLAKLLEWKSAQYRRSGLVNIFAFRWAVRLLERLLDTYGSGFAGMLSALYVNDHLAAAHMGMRSASVWHYWFPSYDQALGKYSPGLVLLLEMARHAETMGLGVIDLGKGESRYKRSLMSNAVPLMEGSVEVSAAAAGVRRLRTTVEDFLRRGPLAAPASIPGGLVLRAERWLRFR